MIGNVGENCGTAFPLRETTSGAAREGELRTRLPRRVPAAFGEKRIRRVSLVCGMKSPVRLVSEFLVKVTVNSLGFVPETAAVRAFSGMFPTLLRVMVVSRESPTGVLLKETSVSFPRTQGSALFQARTVWPRIKRGSRFVAWRYVSCSGSPRLAEDPRSKQCNGTGFQNRSEILPADLADGSDLVAGVGRQWMAPSE